MAELRTSKKISLLETLLSFEVGESLSFTFNEVGVNSVSSIRTMISRYRNDGRLKQGIRFSVYEFNDPKRILLLRTR